MVDGMTPVVSAIRNSIAPSTWSSYCTVWNLWHSFLASSHRTSDCFSEQLLLSFLSYLMSVSYSYSYIVKTLAGISFFRRLHGASSCMQFFAVKCALKGYCKHRTIADTRLPITSDLLFRISDSTSNVCFSPFEALLFKVAFCLYFFGAFRISELLPNKAVVGFGILYKDVHLRSGSLPIFLRQSKTDYMGKGCWITLQANVGGKVCVVDLVRQYLLLRPTGSSFLLVHANGNPLTIYQFKAVLKKCLLVLDLGHMHITFHSFRIGAATEASNSGFNADMIKHVGKWKSNCFRSYVRPNISF